MVDKKRARNLKYRAEHAEELRAYKLRYYAEHREEILARSRKYKAEHTEERHAQSRKYRTEHPEIMQKYRAEHVEEVRVTARKRLYSLHPEQYDAMYEAQGGKCLLCDESAKLYVDHCHTKGHVRGLLCRDCNLILGKLERTNNYREWVTRAVAYLEE